MWFTAKARQRIILRRKIVIPLTVVFVVVVVVVVVAAVVVFVFSAIDLSFRPVKPGITNVFYIVWVELACENIRFCSLFTVPSYEERGETDVFEG